MLVLGRHAGEGFILNVPPSSEATQIEISIEDICRKYGKRYVSVGFDAPREVRIDRTEVAISKATEPRGKR